MRLRQRSASANNTKASKGFRSKNLGASERGRDLSRAAAGLGEVRRQGKQSGESPEAGEHWEAVPCLPPLNRAGAGSREPYPESLPQLVAGQDEQRRALRLPHALCSSVDPPERGCAFLLGVPEVRQILSDALSACPDLPGPIALEGDQRHPADKAGGHSASNGTAEPLKLLSSVGFRLPGGHWWEPTP